MLAIAKIQEKNLRCQKNIIFFREIACILREIIDFKHFFAYFPQKSLKNMQEKEFPETLRAKNKGLLSA